MSSNELSSVDFKRYLDYASSQIPQLLGSLVLDRDGVLVYKSESADTAELESIVRTRSNSTNTLEWVIHKDRKTVIGHDLTSTNEILWGRLFIILDGVEDTALTVSRFIKETISHEIALNHELNCMALELSGRYEELHLIYDSDNQPFSYEKTQNSIKILVGNCIEYLSVDFVHLWLPKQKIQITRSSIKNEEMTFKSAMSDYMDTFLEYTIKIKNSFVINNFNELSGIELNYNIPYKITVTPIKDQDEVIIGSLTLARLLNKQDFTNSDRNILVAMAGKITKTILSIYDNKTGLVKQEGFEHQLRLTLDAAHSKNPVHSLLLINIDKFSVINDVFGFNEGDKLLVKVAQLIDKETRNSDTMARISGDTFAALLPNCSIEHSQKIANKIIESIGKIRIELDSQGQNVSCSIALSELRHEYKSIDRLMADLNIALTVAKEKGGNRIQICNQKDNEQASRSNEMRWIGRIQDALKYNYLVPFYQPIVPLQPEEPYIEHGEILVRYIDATGVIIAPDEFLPAAEHYHMMPALDLKVIEQTLSQIAAAQTAGIWSINLSGQSISDMLFIEAVISLIERSGVAPQQLCFEVTETAAIRSLKEAKRFISLLRELGCSMSLDDFGTGLSSFSYLRELEVDYLKIDGSFVSEIEKDPTARIMVQAIHDVAHSMGLKTIAEFVETESIRRQLIDIGIDFGQGYLFSKPYPLEQALNAANRKARSDRISP